MRWRIDMQLLGLVVLLSRKILVASSKRSLIESDGMNIWIFTHGDGDGLCAGALALAANPRAQVFFTHPFGLLEDLRHVGDQETVIICDIALSESHLSKILERFQTIAEEGQLTYIDHHPLPETVSQADIPGRVVHGLESSASELTYSYFRSRLDLLQTRVAIYGAISDYLDDTPLIKALLKKWDRRRVYFETGVLIQGIEGLKRNYEFKREILSKLANNVTPVLLNKLVEYAVETTCREEEILRELSRHVHVVGGVAYVLGVPFSLGKTAIYARALADASVGVAGEERKGMIDMSLRTYMEEVDLNKILRRIAPQLGGSGGGHPSAAGARVPKENFSRFIDELDKALRTVEV